MDPNSKPFQTRSYSLRFSAILLLFLSVAWANETDLVRISHDPYTDPLAQHATEVEPLLVANDDTIVTSLQVGRFQFTGSDNIGWATSKDGGETWKHGFMHGLTLVTGGPWAGISLPTVAFDHKHHTYLIASMPFDDQGTGHGVLVNRSFDGLNWSEPIVAASSANTNGHWLGCDNTPTSPFYGNCYDAFLDQDSGTNTLVTSNDGGATWGSQVPSPDQTAGLVTSMAIQPNGNVVVLGRNGGPNGDQEYAIRSVDGGNTLEATANIASIFSYSHLCGQMQASHLGWMLRAPSTWCFQIADSGVTAPTPLGRAVADSSRTIRPAPQTIYC